MPHRIIVQALSDLFIFGKNLQMGRIKTPCNLGHEANVVETKSNSS